MLIENKEESLFVEKKDVGTAHVLKTVAFCQKLKNANEFTERFFRSFHNRICIILSRLLLLDLLEMQGQKLEGALNTHAKGGWDTLLFVVLWYFF